MKAIVALLFFFISSTAFTQEKDRYIFDGSYAGVDIPEGWMIEFCNCFTPNGDSIYDCFLPSLNAYHTSIESYTFQIFNRWGKIVFATNDTSKCWDGTIYSAEKNGTPTNPITKSDTYVWRIIISTPVEKEKELVGHITVLAGNI